MDVFEDMSQTALSIMADSSDSDKTTSRLVTKEGSFDIDVVIDKDVEIVNQYTEDRGDDALLIEDTATFNTIALAVGDTLTVKGRNYTIGRTIENDGFVMTVIIT